MLVKIYLDKKYKSTIIICSVVPFLILTAGMIGLDVVHGQCLSGDQIDSLSDDQLKQTANNVTVFYRVTPRHKLKIVKVCFIE